MNAFNRRKYTFNALSALGMVSATSSFILTANAPWFDNLTDENCNHVLTSLWLTSTGKQLTSTIVLLFLPVNHFSLSNQACRRHSSQRMFRGYSFTAVMSLCSCPRYDDMCLCMTGCLLLFLLLLQCSIWSCHYLDDEPDRQVCGYEVCSDLLLAEYRCHSLFVAQ